VHNTFLKAVPIPVSWLIRPALFISLGLHALLFLLPWPGGENDFDPTTSALENLENEVQVTRTPEPVRPTPPSPLPSPSVPPSPAASPPSPPPSPPAVPPPQAVQPQPPPVAASPPPPPAPSPTPSPELPSPTPVASPSPAAPPAVPPPAIPFGDVPLVAGAEAGCFGLGTCRQITGVPFRDTGDTLLQQLTAQGYTVKQRSDLEETGRKVYEIAKDGKRRYLNILSSDINTTVYIVTPAPIQLADLQGNDTMRAELVNILDTLAAGNTADISQFFQPEAFFSGTTPRPETGGQLRLVLNTLPDQFYPVLNSALQASQFMLTEAGGYGGGRLYEVTRGAYTGYLNLVPTQDGSGTIVVLWSQLPS